MVLKRTAPQPEPPVARPGELEPVTTAPKAPSETLEDGERGYGRRLHNDYAEENAVADAVAEADIYVAYGRFQQAINLLQSAVKSDPSNPVPLVKMVEIFCKTDRLEEARDTLESLGELGDDAAYGDAAAAIREAEANGPAMDLGELAEPPEASAATNNTAAVDKNTADINLSLDGALGEDLAGSPNEEASQGSQDPMLGPDLDLDLDLDAGLTASATAETAPDVAQELADTLDMDLDLAGSAVVEPEPEEDGLVYASDADPMDTQLDLARAYIDMGDEEGARPVLDEIIAKGDLRQQAEARELLVSID
jgi:pilus assembly protein FimV